MTHDLSNWTTHRVELDTGAFYAGFRSILLPPDCFITGIKIITELERLSCAEIGYLSNIPDGLCDQRLVLLVEINMAALTECPDHCVYGLYLDTPPTLSPLAPPMPLDG